MTVPDETWMSRLAAGEEQALAELYDQYAPLVYGLALRIVRSREAAEDVTQDVFAFVWERPLAYDPGRGTMRTWLALLAHRRAVDVVRSEERRRRLQSAAQPPPATVPDVEEEVTAADTRGRVHVVVATLPSSLREVVELAYFKGRTYRQVADDLGLAEGTAKSRLRSALRRIADTLAEEGIAP